MIKVSGSEKKELIRPAFDLIGQKAVRRVKAPEDRYALLGNAAATIFGFSKLVKPDFGQKPFLECLSAALAPRVDSIILSQRNTNSLHGAKPNGYEVN